MEKQHFFTLLNKWSRIQFTDVFLVRPTVFELTTPRLELYVRDRSDPPSWLLIGNFSTSENRELLIERYSRWLEEFRHLSVIKDHPRLQKSLTDSVPASEEWMLLSKAHSERAMALSVNSV